MAEAKNKEPKTKSPAGITGVTIDASLGCIKSAIEKRDQAIIVGTNAFNTTMVSALNNRLVSLKIAWDKTGQDRTRALRDTWQNYNKTKRQTRQTERNTTNNAWKTFYNERRACGPVAAQADMITEQIDRVE